LGGTGRNSTLLETMIFGRTCAERLKVGRVERVAGIPDKVTRVNEIACPIRRDLTALKISAQNKRSE
jgi:hypothetical protein